MNTKIKFKKKRSWVEIEMNIMLEYFEKQNKKYGFCIKIYLVVISTEIHVFLGHFLLIEYYGKCFSANFLHKDYHISM